MSAPGFKRLLAVYGFTAEGPSSRKTSRAFSHPSGWRVEHCGHPTANWPWAVVDPDGALHTQHGADCDLGYAFQHVEPAILHVVDHLKGLKTGKGRRDGSAGTAGKGVTVREEQTELGPQTLVDGTPQRAMPKTPLRARKPQKEVESTPLFGQDRAELEAELDAAQGTLDLEG